MALTPEERQQAQLRQRVAEADASCVICERPWHAVPAWHDAWTDRLGFGCICAECAALPARSKARRLRDLARDDVAA